MKEKELREIVKRELGAVSNELYDEIERLEARGIETPRRVSPAHGAALGDERNSRR